VVETVVGPKVGKKVGLVVVVPKAGLVAELVGVGLIIELKAFDLLVTELQVELLEKLYLAYNLNQ